MSFALAPALLFGPDWLVDGEYQEDVLGILKTGKESE
jgi:hypothetical protein